MPELIIVVNQYRNRQRQIRVVSPVSNDDQAILEFVKAQEPYELKEETFSVTSRKYITTDEAAIISKSYGVKTMPFQKTRKRRIGAGVPVAIG